ncbi:glycoside hydrolase family 78 protein [Flavobacterium aquicola]|uniref:SusE-like outer membrane protein n=1 Tax=Flavobacterium aquicola TaxID=1682742 RepID=A0A3E0DXE4_9FLAO|nr:fibronectin type III domain-containing protein [Flavobacterium aquicola]REG90732.1 SusE-like outer membrane protein [Flavobacterium aquicola]
MKNFIYLSIIGLLAISCGGGSDDSETETKNTAPTVPVLTLPPDNKLCVDNTVSFEWNKSTDTNNDNITYKIEIAKDNQFTQIIETAEGTSTSTELELEKNTAYYWRIKATDDEGVSSDYSAAYKFYTAGDAEVNHLPFLPELTAPEINASVNTATAALTWNATDADAEDVLTYEVYFGTSNPPNVKINENNTTKTEEVTLEPATEYFWKVVVKDNKGGETVGQVWRFKTN